MQLAAKELVIDILTRPKERGFSHLQTFPIRRNILHRVRGCAKQPINYTG